MRYQNQFTRFIPVCDYAEFPQAEDIISGVLGQLSDGHWENSPAMNKYWRFAICDIRDGKVGIALKEIIGEAECGRWRTNGFYRMPDEKICAKFANWIKTMIKCWEKDYNLTKQWKRSNTEVCPYMDNHEYLFKNGRMTDEFKNPLVRVCDNYRCYDLLLGRRTYVYG